MEHDVYGCGKSGSRWDLYLELSDRADGILGRAQYNPDLFTAAKIDQTFEDFQRLMKSVTDDPAQSLSRL
jgi:hypothetical protein